MSWARMDDAMVEHRKTRKVLRSGGLAAFGLHALAILHSCRYLLDGEVDSEFVNEITDVAKVRAGQRDALPAALVDAGLWVPSGDGWTVHDYLKYNPSREKVEARRAAEALRKARARGGESA